MKKIFKILIIFLFISNSSLAFSDTLLLRCSSLYSLFSSNWIGNILFVKINEEKKSVLTKDMSENTIGWKTHKLTSVSSNSFIYKQCLSLNCTISENSYHIIDRNFGKLNFYMRTNKKEKFTKVLEYQCKKNNKAF